MLRTCILAVRSLVAHRESCSQPPLEKAYESPERRRGLKSGPGKKESQSLPSMNKKRATAAAVAL